MSWGPNPAPRPGLSPAPSSPQASPYQGLQSATCVPLPLLAPRRAPAQHTASARMGLALGGCAGTLAPLPTPMTGCIHPQGPGFLSRGSEARSGATKASSSPPPGPSLAPGWLSLATLISSYISAAAPAALPLTLAFTCEGSWWGPGLEPSARWAARPEVLAWGILREC